MSSGTTEVVRQELAGVALEADDVPVELAALLRAGGRLVRRQEGASLELTAHTGAVARRAHQLARRLGADPIVFVREATNVRRRTYGIALDPEQAIDVGLRIGLLDDAGRPRSAAPADHEAHPAAMVRGALLGGGSVSAAHRPPHLELLATRDETALQLAATLERLAGRRPSIGATSGGSRIVLKSASAITALLGEIGAPRAAAERREQSDRRRLRAEAQRLANADAANVRRAVEAAGDQVDLVEEAIASIGWDGLSDELRDVALARLANPAASLAEIGALCDPPVGKSAVHRRLARLRTLLHD